MYDFTNKFCELFSDKNAYNDDIVKIGTALSSDVRVKLLTHVNESPKTITELSHILYVSTSAVLFHVKILEDANLVMTEYMSKHGKDVRVITSKTQNILIHTHPAIQPTEHNIEEFRFEMPIGAYTEFVCKNRYAVLLDGYKYLQEPYSPKRFNALAIWCDCGYVEYDFPCKFLKNKTLKELNFTFEICSESPQYRLDWKSDLTFSVNGKELTIYTSPGDFGGKRGKLNPDWWPDINTQYGQLIKLCITSSGVHLNGLPVGDVGLKDLDLEDKSKFSFRIENKSSAEHVGGFNLFSKRFGDYEQDIVMSAICETNESPENNIPNDFRTI